MEIIERKEYPHDRGWFAVVEVDGVLYRVTHERGNPVRIPFKPRSQNRGYHWHGSVYCEGKRLWCEQVNKSTGVQWMLEQAGVIRRRKHLVQKDVRNAEFNLRLIRHSYIRDFSTKNREREGRRFDVVAQQVEDLKAELES